MWVKLTHLSLLLDLFLFCGWCHVVSAEGQRFENSSHLQSTNDVPWFSEAFSPQFGMPRNPPRSHVHARQSNSQIHDGVDDRPVWGNMHRASQSKPTPTSNRIGPNTQPLPLTISAGSSQTLLPPVIHEVPNSPIRYIIRDREIEPYSPPLLQYLLKFSPSWRYCLSYCNIKFESFHGELAATEEKNERLNEFPHMADLGYGSGDSMRWDFCTGSLISKNFVLTAASCGRIWKIGRVTKVRLGEPNYREEKPQIRSVSYIYKHPDYNRPTQNDIALLQLSEPVQFTKYMRPACLHVPLGSGGVERSLDLNSRKLTQWANPTGENQQLINVTDLDKCGTLEFNEKCFGLSETTEGSCSFKPGIQDGSPVHVDHSIFSDYRQCPVVLVGIKYGGSYNMAYCKTSSYQKVYTRISAYIPWIEGIVWPGESTDEPFPW